MLDVLSYIDEKIFLFLNGLHHPILDFIMYWISDRFIWIPLYAYMLYIIIKKYQWNFAYVAVLVALTITLGDQLSVLLKESVARLRPCHNPAIADMVHIVKDHCGGNYGFVSSHAANVFGLALLMGNVLKSEDPRWFRGLIIWAAVVSYSRIYLGVHYPLDILAGALLGSFFGAVNYIILRFINGALKLKMRLT